jgi:hypothetical protein
MFEFNAVFNCRYFTYQELQEPWQRAEHQSQHMLSVEDGIVEGGRHLHEPTSTHFPRSCHPEQKYRRVIAELQNISR